jgi:hypothetical protein
VKNKQRRAGINSDVYIGKKLFVASWSNREKNVHFLVPKRNIGYEGCLVRKEGMENQIRKDSKKFYQATGPS